PHQQCATDPQSSCMKDGLCDGAGACRNYAAGTPCSAASCASGTCDGNGTCNCGKLSLGQPCTLPSECASNFCADGVCCDSACGTTCHACNQAVTLGTCSPVPQGTRCAAAMCSGDNALAARACDI